MAAIATVLAAPVVLAVIGAICTIVVIFVLAVAVATSESRSAGSAPHSTTNHTAQR